MEEQTRIEIGRKLREIRMEQGLTLSQVAALTGYMPQNICRIEQGRYSVSVDIAGRIAMALGYRLEIIPGDIHFTS